MNNGRLRKSESRLINIYFPVVMLPKIEMGVRILDTDRSKFIRNAVREKLERLELLPVLEGAGKS